MAPLLPDDEVELLDFHLDDFSDDSEFDEWNESFIVDMDVDVAEEQVEWDAEHQFDGDRSIRRSWPP
jgi:hypothetical protein